MEFKKLLSIFLAFVLSFGVCTVAFAEETADEYTPIYTAEDLNNIRNNLDGKYVLMNDIDLSVYENWEPIGTPEAPFTGELDGNGYSVLNVTIYGNYDDRDTLCFGLFSEMKSCAVTELNILNVDINIVFTGEVSSTFKVGGLTATAESSTVKDCVVSGNINIEGSDKHFNEGFVGGLFGTEYMCLPENCVNYADISYSSEKISDVCIGGIAGRAFSVFECCNYGDITISSVDSDEGYNNIRIGGIVGNYHQFGCLINNCYNRGTIRLDFSTPSTYVGGIMGESIQFCNSYNSGDIILPENFKGFSGGISGNFGTGVLAMYPGLSTESAYYINEELYPSYSDEEIPCDEDFENVKLLTEEEFRVQDSFVGFDFENVWEMEENGYPVLKNQPKVTVKESIKLEVDETYPIKEGKDYTVTSDSPLCIDYITKPENGEIIALHPGQLTLTVIYDYGYTAEYEITISEPVCDDPIIPEPDPEPINNVDSAEIVHIPLKNRIVFSAGSPALPDGIVIKLKYKDGSEKTETVIYNAAEGCYRAGEERVIGSVRTEVVEYGLLTDTLYINDNTVSVKYDYFVPPTLSYIFMEIVNFVLSIVVNFVLSIVL